MDCTDIIIGSARGKTSRIGDFYTRDRSTPRVDEFWGGKSHLTAAAGFEENGVTTIIFRRKLQADEPTDHSIIDDLTHVIWAKGQEPGKYVHVPLSGLEKEKATILEFYQPDELKYHGHKMQRGITQINFLGKYYIFTLTFIILVVLLVCIPPVHFFVEYRTFEQSQFPGRQHFRSIINTLNNKLTTARQNKNEHKHP